MLKYLFQFLWILGFSFLGEVLHAWIPAPIPASIYGMVLLFLALQLKIVKLEWVKDTGGLLVGIMSVMFVCPAVGILMCWDIVSENLLAIAAVIAVSFVLTFFVSGKVTQLILKKAGEKHD